MPAIKSSLCTIHVYIHLIIIPGVLSSHFKLLKDRKCCILIYYLFCHFYPQTTETHMTEGKKKPSIKRLSRQVLYRAVFPGNMVTEFHYCRRSSLIFLFGCKANLKWKRNDIPLPAICYLQWGHTGFHCVWNLVTEPSLEGWRESQVTPIHCPIPSWPQPIPCTQNERVFYYSEACNSVILHDFAPMKMLSGKWEWTNSDVWRTDKSHEGCEWVRGGGACSNNCSDVLHSL